MDINVFDLVFQRLAPTLYNPGSVPSYRVEAGEWKGIKVSRNESCVSHLLFADDMVLFGEATAHQATIIRQCLDIFCKHSGQRVNFQKSSLFFSKNTLPWDQQIRNSGNPNNKKPGKVLGSPLMHGKLKKGNL